MTLSPPPVEAVAKLVERLRHLVSLNEPRNGGPYQGTAAEACVAAMREAADYIASLNATVAGRDAEIERLKEALREADRLVEQADHCILGVSAKRNVEDALLRLAEVASAYRNARTLQGSEKP